MSIHDTDSLSNLIGENKLPVQDFQNNELLMGKEGVEARERIKSVIRFLDKGLKLSNLSRDGLAIEGELYTSARVINVGDKVRLLNNETDIPQISVLLDLGKMSDKEILILEVPGSPVLKEIPNLIDQITELVEKSKNQIDKITYDELLSNLKHIKNVDRDFVRDHNLVTDTFIDANSKVWEFLNTFHSNMITKEFWEMFGKKTIMITRIKGNNYAMYATSYKEMQYSEEQIPDFNLTLPNIYSVVTANNSEQALVQLDLIDVEQRISRKPSIRRIKRHTNSRTEQAFAFYLEHAKKSAVLTSLKPRSEIIEKL